MNWVGDIGDAVIALYTSQYDKYKANKALCCRKWMDELLKNPKYKDCGLSPEKIKKFINQQEKAFGHAVQKRQSTGFGDLVRKGKEKKAEQQLLEICRYWFRHLYAFDLI